MNLASKQMAAKRTVYGSGGVVQEFVEKEAIQNELVEQVLRLAPYDGVPINKYTLLDDCYRASGGFETGAYVIPHPRETYDKYTRRKQLSYYVNYTKPIVDAHVNPIFRTEPVRQNMSNTYQLFVKDVDGNHTSLTRFMKKTAIKAKLHGVEFIVMDMDVVDDNELVTEEDIVDRRLYPYLYTISPNQINNWATDKFGRLISISYTLTNKVLGKDGNIETVSEVWTWTETICKKSINGVEVKFKNNIGRIPVIPVYGVINATDELIPQSDLYGIARTSLALYNCLSELRERNRNQAFSILTYPVAEDDDYESGDLSLQVGVNDMLMYRAGSQSPEYITPPVDSSNMLENEIKLMIQEIYRQANMQFVTEQKISNISGLYQKWANLQLFQTISELTEGLQNVERILVKMFSSFMNEDMPEFSVTYNHEYGVSDITETLANATAVLAMNICEGLNYETKRKVINAMLSDVDSSVVNKILDDLAKSADKGAPVDVSQVSVTQPLGS